jgi:hypothetical protein
MEALLHHNTHTQVVFLFFSGCGSS